ncbi:MAG TPA: dihydroorotate dehydrogenase [Candidatus Wujingus californicus]|uniref:dihydroorotate dehydrogenase n=1 Tax=Candidatus Wujingus californicus TaxID=3367618 RepID=UPI001DA1EE7C|nr:dihydroorotate dehydrogenase [Planctomycetota bacterium]MDO8094852.1 dihydroorotate dehydrogenase [Candidatus Brocadiales bacterium]MDO8131127.1 dihydroorotate dehydrogenase [Candidatus Brocadiales bacterium]
MVKNPLEVTLKKLRLKTPLMTASGTAGHLDEFTMLQDCQKILKSIGAFVTKGVTLKPRRGNPELRVIETRTGLLNSIGLQNSGAEKFLKQQLPQTLKYNLPIIVNISADTVQEFGELAAYLIENDVNRIISGIEINVSCPNLGEHEVIFGTNPKAVERVVKAVKKRIGNEIVVITKLTPNVTDITQAAKAAIAGGTDVLSMINTLRGMAINIETGRPFLGNVYGGLSGPAIKPIGVCMVYECFEKIPECKSKSVPIIGIGGISTWQDALEYIMAGATAVGIGTAWFVNPNIFEEIIKGIGEYLDRKNTTIDTLVGSAHGR